MTYKPVRHGRPGYVCKPVFMMFTKLISLLTVLGMLRLSDGQTRSYANHVPFCAVLRTVLDCAYLWTVLSTHFKCLLLVAFRSNVRLSFLSVGKCLR